MKYYSTLFLVVFVVLAMANCTKIRRKNYSSASSVSSPNESVSPSPQLVDKISVTPPIKSNGSTISPFEVRDYITKYRTDEYFVMDDLWKQLGIESGGWRGCNGCKVKVFPLQFNNDSGKEAMLRLTPWLQGGTRYLFFRKPNSSSTWELTAKLDLHEIGWGHAQHRMIVIGDQRWFVINKLAGTGSGYSRFNEVWYEITGQKVTPVLSYPVYGFTSFFPNRKASAKISQTKSINGEPKITVQFSVIYSWYDSPNDKYNLWKKIQTATFIKSKNIDKFALDPKRSPATLEEIDMIYGGEGVTSEFLIQSNYENILRIAKGKEGKTKKWLRLFMESSRLPDTPEIQRLNQLLVSKY